MIPLDAYALTALLAKEPAADEVGDLIAAGGTAPSQSPQLVEAADRLGRVRGIAVERTHAAVESLKQSTDLSVRAAERLHSWRAAELRIKHTTAPAGRCPSATGLLLAMTAEADQLATANPRVLATAAEEQIEWIALSDSHRPTPRQ